MWNRSLQNISAAGVLMLLIALAINAGHIEETPSLSPPTTASPTTLSPPVYRERVLTLPEDAGVWHTTVVYPEKNPSDGASRRLAAALASDERLRSLTAQTSTHVYALSDPLWRHRLQKYYSVAAPAIIVQQPDGRVCYKASGANLPSDADALADDIAAALGQCRPRPSPTPTPSPVPTPDPPPSLIPDITPAPPPASDEGTSVLWMIAVPVLAGMAGLFQEWQQSNR